MTSRLKRRWGGDAAVLAAIAMVVFAGGSVEAHDPLSPSGGGPGVNAVVVDVGPAPGHLLGVSNLGGKVEQTDIAGLVELVRGRLALVEDRRPWVRGHRDATYDAVLKVMGLLTAAGMRVSVFIERGIWNRAHGLSEGKEGT